MLVGPYQRKLLNFGKYLGHNLDMKGTELSTVKLSMIWGL